MQKATTSPTRRTFLFIVQLEDVPTSFAYLSLEHVCELSVILRYKEIYFEIVNIVQIKIYLL